MLHNAYSDRSKLNLVHHTSTPMISSIQIFTSIASVMLFRLFSHEVTQTYLHSNSILSRKVFILPKKKTTRKYSELLRVKFSACLDICLDLRRWSHLWESIEANLYNDLGMQPTKGDPSLYYWKSKGKVSGNRRYIC